MLPALIGLTAAAAATAAGYQSMAPTGQWYGRSFSHGARGSKQIALTFDEGANDPPRLIFKAVAQPRQQLLDCGRSLQEAIGEHSNLFRPPYGGRPPSTLHVARELGLETVRWNVTGYDWNAPPAAVIEKKVMRQMRGGDVILLHDGDDKVMGADRGQTVIATENLIRRYEDRGYEFVTVEQLFSEAEEKVSP